ncbi:Tyrosine-protein phosphatase 10D [Lamellibrachia satsuma]|nr:Tyrosine-protein phosphatase 10D [Lamellibrachia satsuma]
MTKVNDKEGSDYINGNWMPDMCDHYWPKNTQPLYYGYLKVQVISETKTDHWIISKFMLTKGRQGRALTHFHYITWPDCGDPDSPQSLINFVRLVRSNLGPEDGPIVVHCSSGVAQTGTFVALDRLLQHIEKHDWVDVYSTVCEMRQYRRFMVRHEANYRCIYHCLLNVLKNDNVASIME